MNLSPKTLLKPSQTVFLHMFCNLIVLETFKQKKVGVVRCSNQEMHMKLLLFIIFICALTSSTSYLSSDNTNYVWICTGKTANSFHNNRGCKGSNSCKTIKIISIEEVRSMKRSPYEICYKLTIKIINNAGNTNHNKSFLFIDNC